MNEYHDKAIKILRKQTESYYGKTTSKEYWRGYAEGMAKMLVALKIASMDEVGKIFSQVADERL